MQSTGYSCQILMKLEFSRQFSKQYSNTKFHENPPNGRRGELLNADGGTDRLDEANSIFSQFCELAQEYSTRFISSIRIFSTDVGKLRWPRIVTLCTYFSTCCFTSDLLVTSLSLKCNLTAEGCPFWHGTQILWRMKVERLKFSEFG
jgi:hypothetical protein